MTALFLTLIVAVIVAGILYWLLSFLPLTDPFKRLVNGLIVICLILFIVMKLWAARGLLPG